MCIFKASFNIPRTDLAQICKLFSVLNVEKAIPNWAIYIHTYLYSKRYAYLSIYESDMHIQNGNNYLGSRAATVLIHITCNKHIICICNLVICLLLWSLRNIYLPLESLLVYMFYWQCILKTNWKKHDAIDLLHEEKISHKNALYVFHANCIYSVGAGGLTYVWLRRVRQ